MDIDNIENLRKQYFEAILNLQDENDIINAMPKPEYSSFFPIITGLIELIEKEIVNINEELGKLDTKDSELIELFEIELNIMQYKKDLCQKYLYESNEDLKTESLGEGVIQNKNLIFASTDYGNIYLERDLKSISDEYCEDILESLRKLQEGFDEENVQKGRALQNNGKLAGLHEIKEFKTRVFYKNLSSDTVYILLARMKKDDNSQLDREEAIIRNKKTKQEFERLKKEIKDPCIKEELIKENQEIYERIQGYINQNRRG